MNHPGNGVPLPTSRHSGSHPDYETKVRTELNNILNSFGNNPALMKDEIIKLQDKIRRAINNNPNIHINSLIF